MTEQEPLDALVRRAAAATEGRRFDEASELLARALERDPDNLRALDILGFVRFFQGRFEDAEQCCTRALSLAPDNAYAHKGLGLCLAKRGKLDEAIEELERAIALKPTWADPYWDLAVVLSGAKRYREAIAVLGRGSEAVPEAREELEGLSARIAKQLGSLERGE
jgi:tetratricopeptide (TPR) repeat protein